jgi:hypothetical protein
MLPLGNAESADIVERQTLSYLHRPAGRYLMYFSPITSHFSAAGAPRKPNR